MSANGQVDESSSSWPTTQPTAARCLLGSGIYGAHKPAVNENFASERGNHDENVAGRQAEGAPWPEPRRVHRGPAVRREVEKEVACSQGRASQEGTRRPGAVRKPKGPPQRLAALAPRGGRLSAATSCDTGGRSSSALSSGLFRKRRSSSISHISTGSSSPHQAWRAWSNRSNREQVLPAASPSQAPLGHACCCGPPRGRLSVCGLLPS